MGAGSNAIGRSTTTQQSPATRADPVSRRRTTTLRRVLVTGGQSRCSWASHVHRDYCSCSCAHDTCGTPVLTSADDCACKQIMRTTRGMQQWARCGSSAAWRVKEPTHERGFTRTRLLLQAATPRKTFASRTAATRTDCRRPERQNCGCRCNKCGSRRQNVAVSVLHLRGQKTLFSASGAWPRSRRGGTHHSQHSQSPGRVRPLESTVAVGAQSDQ